MCAQGRSAHDAHERYRLLRRHASADPARAWTPRHWAAIRLYCAWIRV